MNSPRDPYQQTAWLTIPSARGVRHICVSFITVVLNEDGSSRVATTTAVEAGEAMEAIQKGKSVMTFTKPIL